MKNRLVFSFTLPLSVVLLVQTAAAAPAKEVDDTLTQNSLDVAACYQNPGLATASYLDAHKASESLKQLVSVKDAFVTLNQDGIPIPGPDAPWRVPWGHCPPFCAAPPRRP